MSGARHPRRPASADPESGKAAISTSPTHAPTIASSGRPANRLPAVCEYPHIASGRFSVRISAQGATVGSCANICTLGEGIRPVARQIVIRSGDDLGLAVAEARVVRRLSQQELAAEVGIDRTYLARLENGLTVQMLDRAVRILRLLGATITVTLPDAVEYPDRAHAARS